MAKFIDVDFSPISSFLEATVEILMYQQRLQETYAYQTWLAELEDFEVRWDRLSLLIEEEHQLHVEDLNAQQPPPWVPVFPEPRPYRRLHCDDDSDMEDVIDCPPTVPVSPENQLEEEWYQVRTAWDHIVNRRPDSPGSPSHFHLSLEMFHSSEETEQQQEEEETIQLTNKIHFI